MTSLSYNSQILEERLAISVLLTMYHEGRPMPRGILYSKVARSASTTVARVNELIAAGFISEEITRGEKAYEKIIELTPLGREVAGKLNEIEELIRRE